MTTTEKLAEVNAAISKIMDAQEYGINGRRVRRPELKTLLDERKHLEAQLAAEEGRDVAVAYLGGR